MSALADATRVAHLKLHRSGPFHRIAKGDVRRRDVALALQLHLSCWRAVPQAEVFDAVLGCDAATFFRLDQFEAALRRLHLPHQDRAPTFPKDLAPEAIATGAAYVFLGSHKGGRHLARRMKASGFGHAAQVFLPDDAHDQHWARLSDYIEQSQIPTVSQISRAANHWFAAFDVTG